MRLRNDCSKCNNIWCMYLQRMHCVAVVFALCSNAIYGNPEKVDKTYSIETLQYNKPRAVRVLLQCVRNLSDEDRCLRDAYDEFARRVIWGLNVLGIKCVESSDVLINQKGDESLLPENYLSVTMDLKSVHHKIALTLQITDRYGVVKDQVFTVEPGEWHCEIPRLVTDTIASLVLVKSSVFSTPIFAVIKREEDGRQEIVKIYMDGIDSESVGVSYREILSINPVESGLIYTGLERSSFVVKKLVNDKIIDVDIAGGYSMYDFDIKNECVAFTRITEDGIAELGIVQDVQTLLSLGSQKQGSNLDAKILHSVRFGIMLSPSLSPSAKCIAFLSDEDVLRTTSVYIYNIESDNFRRITTQNVIESVQWCPTNESLIAVLIQESDKRYRVCVIDPNGTVLNSSQPIEHPLSMKWSCDGSGLLVCIARNQQNPYTMYFVPLQTMELHPVGARDTEYLFAAM